MLAWHCNSGLMSSMKFLDGRLLSMFLIWAAHGDTNHSTCTVFWNVALRACLTLEMLVGSGPLVSQVCGGVGSGVARGLLSCRTACLTSTSAHLFPSMSLCPGTQ